jgi:predicted nucleotidyltransferase
MTTESPSTRGKRIANLATEVIAKHVEVERVVLFGKVARNEAGEGSDVDLLIGCRATVNLGELEETIVAELKSRGIDVVDDKKIPMAVDLALRHTWDIDAGGGSGVINRIRKHGITLYPKG